VLAAATALFAPPALASPYETPDLDAASTWEVKVLGEWETSRDERTVAGPILDLTAPIRPGLEASVTFGRAWIRPAGGPALSGVTDTEVAVKWELARPAEDGPGVYVTTEPAIFIPTGSRGLSNDEWRIEIPLIVGREFGPWRLRGMVGYGSNLQGPADAELMLAGVAAFQVNDRFELGVEVASDAPARLVGDYETMVDIGFKWEVVEDIEVQGRLGRTVHQAPGEAPATSMALFVEKAF
jgi:hypothetical protein